MESSRALPSKPRPLQLRALWFMVLASWLFATPAQAGLLANPSFESVPNSSTGQGLLPNNWLDAANIPLGADTWSNDGSYGLAPGDFNHFLPPFVAYNGIRWVAGADFGDGTREAIAQQLTGALTAGGNYTFTGAISHTTLFGGGVGSPGGWELLLSPTASFADPGAVSLGQLAPTTVLDTWQLRSLSFTAPSNASSLLFFVLAPYTTVTGSQAYVGIDGVDLSLTSQAVVPEPSSLLLLGIGAVSLAVYQRRRQEPTRTSHVAGWAGRLT